MVLTLDEEWRAWTMVDNSSRPFIGHSLSEKTTQVDVSCVSRGDWCPWHLDDTGGCAWMQTRRIHPHMLTPPLRSSGQVGARTTVANRIHILDCVHAGHALSCQSASHVSQQLEWMQFQLIIVIASRQCKQLVMHGFEAGCLLTIHSYRSGAHNALQPDTSCHTAVGGANLICVYSFSKCCSSRLIRKGDNRAACGHKDSLREPGQESLNTQMFSGNAQR